MSRKFNIRPPWPLVNEMGKPLKRSTLKYIKILGAEATALFNLVSDVFAVRRIAGFQSAAEVWVALMLENLPNTEFFASEEFDGLTKKKAVADYRSNTQSLRNRSNPYPRGSAHYAFFNWACQIADSSTGREADRYSLYSRSYLPYLKARSELSNYVLSKKSKTKMLKIKSLRI
ncbi:MAG: hypothetical protein AAGB19_13730 [Cyanobacteria bacterium P01_F01_bin.3]